MLASTPATTPRARSYEDTAMTREDCISILECNPHHIRHLPRRMIDNGLLVLALRLGASPDEVAGL